MAESGVDDGTSTCDTPSCCIALSPSKAAKMANGSWVPPAKGRFPTQPMVPFEYASVQDMLQLFAQRAILHCPRTEKSSKRRRLGVKQPPSLLDMLERLAVDAARPLREVAASWKERRCAQFFLMQLAARLYDMSVRQTREVIQKMWPTTLQVLRDNVVVLESRPEVLDMLPETPTVHKKGMVSAYGVLLTWHTRFGRDGGYIYSVLSNCKDVEDQCDILRSYQPLEDEFRDFVTWIAAQCRTLGFIYYACALELNDPDAPTARVHLHAYLSCNWKHRSGPDWRHVDVKLSDLGWNGFEPHGKTCDKRGRANPTRYLQEGLYYCMAPKIGSVFQASNFELWKVPIEVEAPPSPASSA